MAMSTTCRLLYWMIAAGFLLYTLEVPMSWGLPFKINDDAGHKAPEEKDDGHNADGVEGDGGGKYTPCTNSSAPVGLRGYRRYFANDSLIGRPVPCTREDKICFRHNLVFNAKTKICDNVGGGHHHECDLRPNRTEFEHGSGRIVGVCQTYKDPCKGYRMAYDGRCYKKEVVRDVICGCEAKPTRHFLHGVECRSSPAKPIHIQQPEDEGHCLIPDLRFPDVERSQFFRNPFTEYQGFEGYRSGISFKQKTLSLKCDSDQAGCFSQEEVWVNGFTGCHSLLAQGPCPDEHIVAMDINSAVKGQADATCVHVRGGCPPSYKRMVFDDRCHEGREINIEAPGRTVSNQYGHNVFIPRGFTIWFHPRKVNDSCEIHIDAVAPGIFAKLSDPPCGTNDQDNCNLYEVEAVPPLPEI